MKDWNGNNKSVFTTLGSSAHAIEDREVNDYYATDPIAIDFLLEKEDFNHYIWECACGEGHLSKALKEKGFDVKSSDIIHRGFEDTEIIDFLCINKDGYKKEISRDIITNPPYKYAKEFVEKAIELSMDGVKIAMFLKLTFLESRARKEMFLKNPPKTIYVFSSRIKCAKNGDFDKFPSSAIAYAWFVWEVGFKGKPTIEWIN